MTTTARLASQRAALAGALFGFLGVAAGAFGAHALKARLEPAALAVFDTAVRYQIVHALALLGSSWVAQQWPGRAASASAILFSVGIVLFSGSLYVLSLSGEHLLGAITPVGGVLLLLGWLALALAAFARAR
ncbi:MAG TPA: DUF423 domain-containing protein [Burkholderiaceae bacterium]|nr:DUF423 domain-containing protein [Burkholderiaceae bacterium]